MEVIVALRVPESAVFFASLALVHLTGASAICIGLIAVCTIVTEASVVRAVLPADWSDA